MHVHCNVLFHVRTHGGFECTLRGKFGTLLLPFNCCLLYMSMWLEGYSPCHCLVVTVLYVWCACVYCRVCFWSYTNCYRFVYNSCYHFMHNFCATKVHQCYFATEVGHCCILWWNIIVNTHCTCLEHAYMFMFKNVTTNVGFVNCRVGMLCMWLNGVCARLNCAQPRFNGDKKGSAQVVHQVVHHNCVTHVHQQLKKSYIIMWCKRN